MFVPWDIEAITHSTASTALKSLVTVLLSGMVGAVATVAVGEVSDWQVDLTAIGAAWVRGYVPGLADSVTRKTVGTGIGRDSPRWLTTVTRASRCSVRSNRPLSQKAPES